MGPLSRNTEVPDKCVPGFEDVVGVRKNLEQDAKLSYFL
jgi:hypothetical protein